MRRILMLLVVAVLALSAGALSLLAQEAPAYIIAKVTVTDPDGYAQYGAGFNRVFGQYEGEIVAFSEDPTILEGEWSATRTVIIRFPSKASALEWYESDGYQALVKIRQSASTGDVVLIDGF